MRVSELISELKSVLDTDGDIEAVYDKMGKVPMSLPVSYVTMCGVCVSDKKFAVMTESPIKPLYKELDQPERLSSPTAHE